VAAPPPLVLAPGMLCDAGVWAGVIAALGGGVDIRVAEYGQARSMTAMAEALLAAAPPVFALAGHSMGGRVALEAYRLEPHRIAALALIGTEHRPAPAGEAGEREHAGRLRLLQIARERGMRAVGEAWLESLVDPSRLRDAALVGAVLEMIARQTPERLEAEVEAGRTRPDSRALLPKLACPALFLAGRNDRLRPPEVHAEMAALAPRARLVVLEGCGHMLPMERPGETAAALREWLEAGNISRHRPA